MSLLKYHHMNYTFEKVQDFKLTQCLKMPENRQHQKIMQRIHRCFKRDNGTKKKKTNSTTKR
jgi:hypothetical protein